LPGGGTRREHEHQHRQAQKVVSQEHWKVSAGRMPGDCNAKNHPRK
jgi:hypothetical protein